MRYRDRNPNVAWAILQPVPSHLVAPLLVLAYLADDNGENVVITMDRLGALTHKTADQARKDIHQLVARGLITITDPVGGRRPRTYKINIKEEDPNGAPEDPRRPQGRAAA